MRPGFIEYVEKGKKAKTKPLVSVKRRARIGLNRVAVRLLGAAEGKTHVKLYVNVEERVLGIKAVDVPEPNTFSVTVTGKAKTGAISAHLIFEFFNLDIPEHRRQIEADWDEDEQTLFVPLP